MIHLYDKDAEAISLFLHSMEERNIQLPTRIEEIWKEITFQLVQQKLHDKN